MKAVLGINDSSFQLIGGKSLLAWNIENLRDNGVTTIFLVGAKEPAVLPENVVFIKDPGLGDGGVLSLLSKKISSGTRNSRVSGNGNTQILLMNYNNS